MSEETNVEVIVEETTTADVVDCVASGECTTLEECANDEEIAE